MTGERTCPFKVRILEQGGVVFVAVNTTKTCAIALVAADSVEGRKIARETVTTIA